MLFRLSFFIFVFLLLISLGPLKFLNAQSPAPLPESDIINNQAIVDFPQSVSFQLELDHSLNIVDAALIYDVEQASCLGVSTTVPVEAEGAKLEWEWAMVRSGNPPPGVDLWWEWEVTDNQGQTYVTPRQTLTFEDERFSWETITQDNITLNWYQGEDVGPLLLEAAASGLDLLEEDLGIELQEDVTFYIYGSSADMREAVLSIQDWAGGVAFPEYSTILMGVPPSLAESWGKPTVRHELAHLALGRFGQNCVGGHRPTWLEEGLATYAEGEPGGSVLDNLEQATKQNSFAPLRSLNGPFPAHGDDAGSAYSQSYSTVKFLREEYGKEKLQDLLLLLAQGESYDDALEQIYGQNVDSIEQEWRQWLGLPLRPVPPTPTPISAAAIPTVMPLSAPVDLPTPPAAAQSPAPSPDPGPTAGICGLGLVPLFLVGAISWRKRKGA